MARSKVPAEAWAAAEMVYPTGGTAAAEELLRVLGHTTTRAVISKHMNLAGIAFDPGPGGRWTEEEEALLREHAPTCSAKLLKERYLPGRTAEAIQQFASKIGVPIARYHNRHGGRTTPMLKLGPWPEDEEVRAVFIGDQQAPENDWAAHRVVCEFLRYYLGRWRGRKYVFVMGDLLNGTPLGRFPHAPETPDMAAEISDAKRLLRDYAESAPGAEFVVIEGNHEYRRTRKIEHDPSLVGMVGPWWELFDLDGVIGKDRWQWIPYMQGFVDMAGLWVHHGYKVSQHSAYTAKAHVENVGTSIICGHTHRLGTHYKTWADREVVGIENGSLCQPQSYVPGVANWQLGFTYTRHFGERFVFQQVRIVDGQGFAEGRWFGQRGLSCA